MIAASTLKLVLAFGPAVVLLMLGLIIALPSGVIRFASGQGIRQLAGNLSSTIVTLLGCIATLAVIQICVGLRIPPLW